MVTVFDTETEHRVYNLDPAEPDNDIDRFQEDREYIANTVPLGNGNVYAVVRRESDYLQKARGGMQALKAVDAFDRGGFRGAYDALSSQKKSDSGSSGAKAVKMIQEQLSGDDDTDSAGQSGGVIGSLLGDVPDHLLADTIQERTALGDYIGD